MGKVENRKTPKNDYIRVNLFVRKRTDKNKQVLLPVAFFHSIEHQPTLDSGR